MPKAYLILYDGDNLLVGSGGKSGKQKVERQGLHLPGGTMKNGEKIETVVERELKEETGISLDWYASNKFSLCISGATLNFLVAWVPDVPALIGLRIAPTKKNKYDEPFSVVSSIPVNNCQENIGFKTPLTDWFGKGLAEAFRLGYLNPVI